MFFLALATDYDGTIAHNSIVTPETVRALQRCKDSGRKLLLVTGRELPDLRRRFPGLEIFDLIVAENGALLYNPATNEERILSAGPPSVFVEELIARKVSPLSVG